MDSSRVAASIGSSPIASRSAVGVDDVAVVTDATDHDHGDDDDDDDAPRASQLGRFKLLEVKRKPQALILAQEVFASYVCWPVSWYLSSAPLSFLARSPVLGKRIRDRKSIGISAEETEIYRDSAVTVAAPLLHGRRRQLRPAPSTSHRWKAMSMQRVARRNAVS